MAMLALGCPIFGLTPTAAMFGQMFYRGWSQYGSSFSSRRWLVKDGCGLFTMSLTNFFIFGAMYVLNVFLIWPFYPFFQAVFHAAVQNTLLGLGAYSQWQAMLTNPGAVPQDAEPMLGLEECHRRGLRLRKCRRCGTYKPSRAHHDSVSRRCVVKMDHYCPWVNNVVGIANHKFFILFVAYVFLASAYAIGLIVTHLASCGASKCIDSRQISVTGNLFIMLVLLEAVLFGLFTVCMFCEQISGVLSGASAIDRLKGDNVKQRTRLENLQELFGHTESRLEWALPVHPQWRDWNDMVGYIVPNPDLEKCLPVEDGGVSMDKVAPSQVSPKSVEMPPRLPKTQWGPPPPV